MLLLPVNGGRLNGGLVNLRFDPGGTGRFLNHSISDVLQLRGLFAGERLLYLFDFCGHSLVAVGGFNSLLTFLLGLTYAVNGVKFLLVFSPVFSDPLKDRLHTGLALLLFRAFGCGPVRCFKFCRNRIAVGFSLLRKLNRFDVGRHRVHKFLARWQYLDVGGFKSIGGVVLDFLKRGGGRILGGLFLGYLDFAVKGGLVLNVLNLVLGA